MRCLAAIELKAPSQPEPPAMFLVPALQELEEMAGSSRSLVHRAGASTLLRLYDRRIAHFVFAAHVRAACGEEAARLEPMLASLGYGSTIQDGDESDNILGAEAGVNAMARISDDTDAGAVALDGDGQSEAAWYLSQQGAPPLHYDMLVALRGTEASQSMRGHRYSELDSRLGGLASTIGASARAPPGTTAQQFIG